MVSRLIATVLNRLAKIYEERSEYLQAEKHYQHAVRILNKARTSVAVEQLRVQVLGDLAKIYRIQGHYDKAEALFRAVLPRAPQYSVQLSYHSLLFSLIWPCFISIRAASPKPGACIAKRWPS